MTGDERVLDANVVPDGVRPNPPPQVLAYAGPTTRPPRFRLSDHARTASVVGGILAATACLIAGKRNAPLVVVVPFGALVVCAMYVVLVARRQWADPLAVTQLVVALSVAVTGVVATFTRGGQSDNGPTGLQYWVTYNPGYYRNPRWAMQYLWLAGVAAGWFLVVAARARWGNRTAPALQHPEAAAASSPASEPE